MTYRTPVLAALSVFTLFLASPAHLHGLQPAQAAQHDDHHPGTADPSAQATAPDAQAHMMGMMVSDARLDALVTKMNAAKGAEKTDAIAELLTALVQEHRAMRPMMSNMMNMMMSGRGGTAQAMPPMPGMPATPAK